MVLLLRRLLFTLVIGQPQRRGLSLPSSPIELLYSLLLVDRGLVEYDLIQAVTQPPILLFELRDDQLQGLNLSLRMSRPFSLIHDIFIEVSDVLILLQHLSEGLLCLNSEIINSLLVVLKLLCFKLLQRLEFDPELFTFTVFDIPSLHFLIKRQLECLGILADDSFSFQRLLQLVVCVHQVLHFLLFDLKLNLKLLDRFTILANLIFMTLHLTSLMVQLSL